MFDINHPDMKEQRESLQEELEQISLAWRTQSQHIRQLVELYRQNSQEAVRE